MYIKSLFRRTNKEILTYFISKDELKLTKGLTDILNQLKKSETPMAIASATVKENVEFYVGVFHLDRWFNFDKGTFDDGSFPRQTGTGYLYHCIE
ncbi:hypothetical protein AXI59_15705 [Bacillus nakamurai]|uniref:Uncharacterized protein n=1 Tax=Bacillus nakamurai TaxID=1793963 RepID=A0A150F2R3_9BACI|nr:hypothetical protein [Bacillus nakamurai]KXZ13430.1 hypothetical protein AXI58_04655 [Bacillus nakamurai]KXZ18978.1 hypothetical protein AXI59_15705 [Bacillus nakamurai]